MNWLHQILSRSRPRIPDQLWRESLVRLPFLQRLAPGDLDRLKDLCETLLDRKTFTSAAGFELTDEKAVLIAAQAALPVLNLDLKLYADMAGIIVYPSAFVVPQQEVDEAGVIHEWRQPVSGEAIDAGGAVVLSWEDAEDCSAPGYNVVIHEFVHKIDMADGSANGCPPFLAAFHTDIDRMEWQQVFSAAYADFLERVEAAETELEEGAEDEPSDAFCDDAFADLPFDPYAAQHPAEFFAVASEAFFVLPEPLATDYPDVYRLLSRYYRQDPLASCL
jgi:Mlc titration factor MtfA (ptsG expression regulator)